MRLRNRLAKSTEARPTIRAAAEPQERAIKSASGSHAHAIAQLTTRRLKHEQNSPLLATVRVRPKLAQFMVRQLRSTILDAAPYGRECPPDGAVCRLGYDGGGALSWRRPSAVVLHRAFASEPKPSRVCVAARVGSSPFLLGAYRSETNLIGGKRPAATVYWTKQAPAADSSCKGHQCAALLVGACARAITAAACRARHGSVGSSG